MEATLDPVHTQFSPPLPASPSPSASSSTGPGHAYPSPPVTAYDETSASEDEAHRGRSKLASPPRAAAEENSCSDAPSRPSPSSPSTVKSHCPRRPSGSANKTNEKPHEPTADEMQELVSSPEPLPMASAPEQRSIDQATAAQTAAQRDQLLRHWHQTRLPISEPQHLQLEQISTDGLLLEPLRGDPTYGSASHARGQPRRLDPPRTVSTPPMTRTRRKHEGEPVSQPSSPTLGASRPRSRPSALNLNGDAANGSLKAQPLSAGTRTGPTVMASQQQQQQQHQHQQKKEPQRQTPATKPPQAHVGPSPPSPIPTMIPLPPMSLPTHLQLELAGRRPSPLFIHQSHSNDVPYESYAVKLERLKNVLLLPLYLERTLYFGALACLDAWLYTFTILPIRFFMAFGVLLRWWGYVVSKETQWLVGYVRDGLVRLWTRGRTSRPRRPSRVSDKDPPRSRSRVRRTAGDAGDASASVLRDRVRHARSESRPESSSEHPHPASALPNSGRHPGPKTTDDAFTRHERAKSVPSALSPFHKADLLQGAVIICSSFALMTLDASRMYHFIRAQSAIKLYVIYNILEVSDRLLSAIGQDILECLFSSETLCRNASGRSKILLPLGMFILALVYNCLHSVALYYQVITLNVAVNSYSNALLTLLLSNQFVEIKSTVFKRFEKDNVFQLTCADIVERFQLWIMLLIIGMRNIVEVGAFSVPGAGFDSSHDGGGAAVPLRPPSILPHSFTVLPPWLRSGEALSPFLIVVGSEMLVDAVKHAYVSKFNNIKPTFYGRTLDVLCKDYYTNAFVTPSLTRRLGLAVVPLSCLFIRASIQTYHMFLSAHVPMPLPASTHTSLMEESAVPSSPAMMAALSRFDALIRDSLGRATYGYPYGSPLNSRPWYAWTSDDSIAALTMVVVFFIAFLVLLIVKLLVGMLLLQYSRSRYARMKHRESLVAQGKLEREVYDAAGKRVGARAEVEVSEDKARWINADETEGLGGGRAARGGRKKREEEEEGEYMGVARYEMVAKRIW